MLIGERLKTIREAKHLSQGDIEERTGLLQMHISRIENGHTIPAIETLERFARALEVPLYQFFYAGEEPPKSLKLTGGKLTFGSRKKKDREFERLRRLLSHMTPHERALLLATATRMAARQKREAFSTGRGEA